MPDFLKYNSLATFTRNSPATNPDTGLQVLANAPRYVTGFDGKAGSAILVEPGTTNLPSANVATGGDASGNTTGFSAWYATETITRDTTKARQGTGCIKIVTPGGVSGEGVYIVCGSCTSGQPYSGRISVYAPVGATMQAFLLRDYGVQVGTNIQFVGTGDWKDITDIVITANANSAVFGLIVQTRTPAQAVTFWIDMVQVENKSYSTYWQNPADGARVFDQPSVALGGLSAIGTLVWRSNINTASKRNEYLRLMQIFGPASGSIQVRHNTSGYWELIAYEDAGGAGYNLGLLVDSAIAVGWHHFALVFSSAGVLLYVDGASRISIAGNKLPSVLNSFYIGTAGSSESTSGCAHGNVAFYHNRVFTASEVLDHYLNKRGRGNSSYLPFDGNLNIYSALDLSTPPLVEPYQHEADDEQATIESPKEAGYKQTRPRFTRVVKKWHVGYPGHMTDEDQSLLEAWQISVKYRSDSFIWIHPRSGTWYTVRLASGIKFKHGVSDSYWQFEFDLEEV